MQAYLSNNSKLRFFSNLLAIQIKLPEITKACQQVNGYVVGEQKLISTVFCT